MRLSDVYTLSMDAEIERGLAVVRRTLEKIGLSSDPDYAHMRKTASRLLTLSSKSRVPLPEWATADQIANHYALTRNAVSKRFSDLHWTKSPLVQDPDRDDKPHLYHRILVERCYVNGGKAEDLIASRAKTAEPATAPF